MFVLDLDGVIVDSEPEVTRRRHARITHHLTHMHPVVVLLAAVLRADQHRALVTMKGFS